MAVAALAADALDARARAEATDVADTNALEADSGPVIYTNDKKVDEGGTAN